MAAAAKILSSAQGKDDGYLEMGTEEEDDPEVPGGKRLRTKVA